jgi:hypothetical protein
MDDEHRDDPDWAASTAVLGAACVRVGYAERASVVDDLRREHPVEVLAAARFRLRAVVERGEHGFDRHRALRLLVVAMTEEGT